MGTNYIIKKDKQGRTIFCCPNCGRTLITFYNEVETIRAETNCECGQKIYFKGEADEEKN